MSVKQLYDITPLAGQSIAGRRRAQGATSIELTAEEAEFELAAGTIVPTGQPIPPVTPVPVLIATDIITYTRNGRVEELTYAAFLARLLLDLGGMVSSPPAEGDGLTTNFDDEANSALVPGLNA